MPILTIEAIRENPWNVITHTLPTQPTELLLELACLAAEYCRDSEYRLMEAARDGRYKPTWWDPSDVTPDVHEESEEHTLEADRRLREIRQLSEREYGESLNR